MQGINWLKNQYDEVQDLKVIKQDDPKFKEIIEQSIENGRVVIIE